MLKNNSGPFQCALPDTTFSSRNFSWNCWILVQIAQLWIKEENLVVQSLSCVWPVVTPWTAARQAPLSCTISQSLLKPVSIESAMLLTISSSIASISSCLQSFPASESSNESALRIRWPKHWNFRFNVSPSNEYLGFISLGRDWVDLLAVPGTLKTLQHHNLKASILQHSTVKFI